MKHDSPDIPEDIAALPKDVGWILFVSGLLSEVVAGVPPYWVAGMLILWPQTSLALLKPFRRRCPKAFNRMLAMVSRYAHDLEARYPSRPVQPSRDTVTRTPDAATGSGAGAA